MAMAGAGVEIGRRHGSLVMLTDNEVARMMIRLQPSFGAPSPALEYLDRKAPAEGH